MISKQSYVSWRSLSHSLSVPNLPEVSKNSMSLAFLTLRLSIATIRPGRVDDDGKFGIRQGQVLEYIDLRAESAGERPNPRQDRAWPEEFAVLRERMKPAETGDSEPVLFTSIHQVAAQQPKFVLLGPPGAGKTTAIRRLALDGARRRLESPELVPLPLLLDLSRWADETGPVNFVRKHWPFASEASEALSRGDVFLYLDGLNEMGAAGPANAKRLEQWLNDSNGPNQVIVNLSGLRLHAGSRPAPPPSKHPGIGR
jgi:hypothetical protein